MKKCNKKTIVGIIIAACLLLGVICGILFAVFRNRTTKINVIENKDAYDWSYTKAFVGEKDADMNIDGALTEELWQDKQWLTHVEKGVNMRYTTAFTEKGLYIAAIAEDKRMQWNDTRAFMNNSSFRFYVVSNAAKQFYCFDCMSFYVDEKDSSCRQETRFEAKAVRGTGEDGTPTLTAEFFATWEDLHYEVDPETGMPEFARIVPMYRYVEGFESADNAFLKPIFAEVENDRVRNALLFDEKGYINVDQENAELGNAGNGFAKSDGWDLTDLDGGEDGVKTVHTTVEHGQAIFFRNINSSRYSYSVDMKIKGGLNDPAPTAGVCDMKSASEFNCMRIAGNPYLDSGKKTLTYYLLDFYETLWHDILYGDRTEGKGSDVINIRVIKDNTRYYYIFNDVYEFSVDLDWLGGKTCPGLYSLGADVEFSNWQVTDYEGADKDEAFTALTDEYMYVVKVPENTSGGTLSLDKLAIRKGSNEAVKLTIRPAKGYMLTDILINGRSEYDKLIKDMKEGVIELHPTESLYIEAVFTPLPMDSCIRITGLVLRDNGAANIGLPYKVQSSEKGLANLLFFYDSTTTIGAFDVLLLRAGDYEIGGRKFSTNGVYTLTFEGIFPRGEKNTFTIDTKESRYDGLSYCEWDPITLNPLKVANMAERANGEVQTTNTSYKDTYSYYVYNDELEGSFRVEMTAKANNDNWPCYGFTVEDESNNSVQFFAGGATTYRVMDNYDGMYKQSDKGATFVDGQCKMALIYDEHTDRFYFYVNDVLFDSVKRSDYMNGTKFRYGIVGYMTGADGSPRPVTASDPFAVFTKPELTREFSVSVPSGATLTMDGERISGKSVPVLSVVTVSIPVSQGKQYVIYLDGKPLETHHRNGRITATFTVTGKHKVTYAEAYITEWIHEPFDYDVTSGGYCVLDHNVTAAGGYFASASIPEGSAFLLETTLRNMDDSTWPSAGVIVGTDKDRYVRFSMIRNTDANPNVYALRVGNANGKEIVKWFADIETLKDNKPFGAGGNEDMQLGVVYQNGYYYVYVNGVMATAFEENELLSGETSIKDSLGSGNRKLGLFAERKVTFPNWSYSTDVSKYMGNMPDMEWIHAPFVYDSKNNSYRVTDHNSVANGGYIGGTSYEQGTPFLLEATVRDMDTELWPSTGLIVGTDKNHYVRFSVLRNTDVNPNVYALRAGNANGKEIVKWFADIEPLKGNKPFGADDKGNMELGLAYEKGIYYVFVNGVLATTFGENELLSGEISIKDSLGTGNVKLGLFAERKITFVNWNHSADVSKYLGNMPKMEWIHSPFVYDPVTGQYQVTDHNSVANGGYLEEYAVKKGESFLLEATVRDMDTETWPSTGLIVGADKDHYVRFSVIRNTDANPNVYALRIGNVNGKEFVKWFSDLEALKDNTPFGADGSGDMKLSLVYHNGYYFVYVNGALALTVDENMMLSGEISIKDSLGAGDVKLGLFAERKITFVEWKHSVDKADIGSYIGRKITAAEGVSVSVNSETRENGTVYLRETATVSMPVSQGQELHFLVDGVAVETTIENGMAVASFVVTGDHSVTVSRASAVSGKVSAVGAVDFTTVEVIITNENGQTAQTVIPDANGNFTANLARGVYYISAKTDKLMSNVAKVVVEGGVVSGADLILCRPLIIVQTGVYTYDYKTGYYTTPASIADNRAYMGSVEQGTPFVLEAEIKDMTTADYPSVGFRIETGGENYLYFNLRYDTGAGVYQYWLKRWPWAEYGNIERLTTFEEGSWLRTTPFKDGTLKMALVYKDGYYYAYFNGELTFKISETEALNGGSIQDAIGDGTRRLNLFAEREVTFVDWNYSTDISGYADSLVGVKLQSAKYKNQWGGETADFVFEPDKLLYRGTYGWYNTGVLETPADVKNVDEWVLEADVQIIADWQWPSVGFALYNGSDFAQNVKFEILRTTPEPYGDYSGHRWQLRVNGKDYWPGTENSTNEWLAANQEVLKGKVHLAVAHVNGEYKMYINGTYLCAIAGEEAANLTNGWGSIRPGFYAEQEATFENWSYSAKQTDLEKYR